LPITALRETPIAAAIWLQVMPLPMQLRSCSMRSGVQVALEGTMLFGAGATGAGSRALDVIGGIAGDESGSDGAIDGDIERPRSIAAAVWAAEQGVCPRAAGNRETQDPEAKIGVRPLEPIRKEMPQTRPKAFSSRWQPVRRKKSAPPSNYAAFTEPHPASRMANPLLEWRPYAALYRGRFLSLLSENPRRIETSHDSTRLPRVKMAL
jgi:hypothetical protein